MVSNGDLELIGAVIALFLFVLAVLWFILPFAIFGIKGRLDHIARLLQHQNDHIASLRTDLARLEQERKAPQARPE